MQKLSLIFLLTLINASLIGKKDREIDLKKYFDEYEVNGSFVLYDLKQDQYIRYNPERCKERFSAASTFKIPNTLIALEEGIMEDENSIIKWDSVESPVKLWNQDLSLADAFRTSCVPCYAKIADNIGLNIYKKYLRKLDYGNQKVSIHTDDPYYSEAYKNAFWIIGDIKISQEEQIDFLKKLYQHDLPVSQKAMETTKGIMVEDKTDNYILSAKTGWTNAAIDGRDVGWYVGYVEKKDQIYFFATNIESKEPKDNFARARKAITLNILKELDLL